MRTTINLINLIYFNLLCEFDANELSRKRHILTSEGKNTALKCPLKCVTRGTDLFSLF